MTLADLALLLVGFLVLVQSTADRSSLARGLRSGFAKAAEAPMPLAANAAWFAPGSARLSDPTGLIVWSRDGLRDPRITITVTGTASAGEGILLASDRARAVAAALIAGGIPADRLTLVTAGGPARATLTLAFDGEPARSTP